MNCRRLQLVVVVLLLLAASMTCVRADSADERFALATGYYGQRRWQEAVREFRQLLEEAPRFNKADSARFLCGESLVQLGKYDDAYQLYREFLRNQPNHRFTPQAQFRTGETAYLIGKLDVARQELKHFHERFAKHALNGYALPYLGELALAANDINEAQASFQKAMEQFTAGPLIDQCRFGLARTFELQGHDAEAHRFYQFLASDVKNRYADDALLQQGALHFRRQQHVQAQRKLNQLTTEHPKSPLKIEAKYWLGMSLTEEEKWDEAAAALSPAAKEVGPKHKLAPAMHFAAAEALRRISRQDDANSLYGKVVEAWPKCQWAPDSLQAQIQIAFDGGDHESVEELARDFERKFPQDRLLALVRETVGRSALQREEFDLAATVFADLVNCAESDEAAIRSYRYLLGLARIGAKKYRDAMVQLDMIDSANATDSLAAAVHLARSSALIGLNDHARAIEAQQAYLRLQPKSVEANEIRAQLCVSLAKTGKFDEAVEVHRELAAIEPPMAILPTTTRFLADAAFAQERYEVSQELYGRLANAPSPEMAAEGLAGLAWTQAKLGAAEESAASFTRLLLQHPTSPKAPEAAVMAARQLKDLGKGAEALKLYERVVNDYKDSEFFAEAALAAASYYETDGEDKQKAADLLWRVSTDKPQLAQMDAVLYQRAWLLVELNQPREAAEIFERINKEYQDSRYWADATYRLAERAANANNNERARELADELLQSNVPGSVRCHALYFRGQLAAANEDWNDVEKLMQQVVKDFPDSTLRIPARYWVAEANYRAGKTAEAALQFDSLANDTRDNREPWLAIIALRRAQLLVQQEKWLDAFELASGIAERYPEFRQQYEVDYVLGRCLANRGEFRAARDAYERVVRSPAGNRTETAAMAQWMIGESFLHQKNYDEAIRSYHRVDTLYSFPRWQAAALLQAAKCHEAKGEWQNAIRLYTSLLKKHADTTFAEEASQRLRAATEKVLADSAIN